MNTTNTDTEKLRKQAFKKLRTLHREKRPGVRVPVYDDTTANGLTKCIIDYLTLKGYQAERILCTGAPVPAGNGLYKMGPTTMDKGTADISATIKGRSVKIEVKAGNDRLSSYQIEYRNKIHKAGGVYIVTRDFVQFLKDIHEKVAV